MSKSSEHHSPKPFLPTANEMLQSMHRHIGFITKLEDAYRQDFQNLEDMVSKNFVLTAAEQARLESHRNTQALLDSMDEHKDFLRRIGY